MLRPPGKPRASLVAAARAQPTGSEAINAPSSPTPNPSLAAPPDSADVPQSSSRTVSVEPRTSTPILPDASQEAPVAKLKFKPKVPIRRVKQ